MSMRHRMKIHRKSSSVIIIALKVAAVIFIGVVLSFVILFFPDFLLLLRNFVSSHTRLLHFHILTLSGGTSITASNYIQMVLTTLSLVVTAILSCVAYQLSKGLSKLQFSERRAKSMLWSKNVYNFMYSNLKTIRRAADLKSFISDLDIDENDLVAQYIINLYAESLIDQAERDMLQDCLKKFKTIAKKGIDDPVSEKIMNEIISSHIDLTESDLVLKDDIKKSMNKIKKIGEEDEASA